MKSVVVRIPRSGLASGKGSVVVEAEGFQGTACQEATKALIDSLGKVASEEAKAEMYAAEEAVERLSLDG